MSPRNRKASRRSSKAAARRHMASRTRGPGRRVVFALLLVVTVAALAGTLVLVFGRSGGEPGSPRAAIVDQLSLTFPNPTFAEDATSVLEQQGYAVDYYPGEEATVELFRDLAGRGYRLIVFRVHSGLLLAPDQTTYRDDAVLFTSQPYDSAQYVQEQQTKRLAMVRYDKGGEYYFGIPPNFITSSMPGSLPDATVIMMGCYGLRFDKMAQAFVARGADEVVGWDGLVSAEHTDAATERLLEHMLTDGLSVGEAVELTMQEVGPDPVYGSILRVYPTREAAFALP